MTNLKNEAPVWDLKHLYDGMDDPQIERDFKKLSSLTDDIVKQKGTFASLSTEQFEALMQSYQERRVLAGRLNGYASLLNSEDMADKKIETFYQSVIKKSGALSQKMAFFTNEIANMDDTVLAEHLQKSSYLGKISRYFDQIKADKQFLLPDAEEAELIERNTKVIKPLVLEYQKNLATMSGKVNGKEYSLAALSALMQDPDEAVREEAYHTMVDIFADYKDEMADIHSKLASMKFEEDERRGYKTASESRNRDNGISDKALSALVEAFDDMAPDLSQRYYKMRANLQGVEKFKPWNVSAPLAGSEDGIDASWSEIKSDVIAAWDKFSSKQAKWVRAFFDENRVHARKMSGKRGGAYAHPITSEDKPFLFMNFEGLKSDAKTLAHEMGHGIHFTSYAQKQEELVAHPPLAVMEIPSFFAEMIYLDHMKETTKDPKQLRNLMMDAVANRLNSVGGQLNFHKMETGIHDHVRKNGKISAEEILDISKESQKAFWGDVVEEPSKEAHRWMRIHHLIKAPFYVYAYAVDACISMTLYDQYKQACDAGQKQEFVTKWQNFLESGNTKSLTDMMADFGLDLENPNVWKKGLKLLSNMISDIEDLNKKIDQAPSAKKEAQRRPLRPQP